MSGFVIQFDDLQIPVGRIVGPQVIINPLNRRVSVRLNQSSVSRTWRTSLFSYNERTLFTKYANYYIQLCEYKRWRNQWLLFLANIRVIYDTSLLHLNFMDASHIVRKVEMTLIDIGTEKNNKKPNLSVWLFSWESTLSEVR